ncbi:MULTISPECIES: hypothetical protein [Thermoactinomyces]|jgi:hypothetical protein|uniref:Uncharacterized protein n=1 Tax=Thermoactinomyces daqus TaxID=1329516 RepID=A0A7W1XAX6_9BACL|nr:MULTISPECIES: hypothetical protein [Thermoactinomyces]MBA4543333.1 hypothetical protein [Thermoactinomyces daqus]MBH8598474.1 hypothetical protein [Thermoactinomyces sp. CICC 10523]MBH8604681.1 hypothetical protein [Thermoactinomyces sp. CICC 10522]MBH8606858.1 hypothetical protein [Thermoactinomyces sp. CICC 10521]
MAYLLLLIATYIFMSINRRLLGIPGFFYYSSVRPIVGIYFRDKLLKVEEVYYWELAETLGDRAQLAILPAYFVAFDLLSFLEIWQKWLVFLFLNYLWWVVFAAYLVKGFIPQTPALRPRTTRTPHA